MSQYRPSWLSFRRFAAFTTGLVLSLMMLGVYTAATGSGLACSAQWPLCDNGLLPQTIPSFIEWFHRLVAMVAGFFILGTALWAFSGDDLKTKTTAILAVVLLPLQVSIGAVTVTLNGLIPGGYAPSTQGAHLVVALTIFTALVLTTLRAYSTTWTRPALDRARLASIVALGLVPVSVVLSRVFTAVSYSPAAQAGFYGVSLALFAALVAATVWLGETPASRLRVPIVAALGATFGALLLGRDLVFYTPAWRATNTVLFVLVSLLVGAVVWALRRQDTPVRQESRGVSGD
ncbi:COX15/CtaA family protein [Salinigranum halophilum]|uniref:COX15/CtaA family protein n=1 Tax=Salinigranum halophilum TaxID=2565931 RepID=UPI001F02259E|nr:COX15/CtaA family protein [Salinigranum halophilum]